MPIKSYTRALDGLKVSEAEATTANGVLRDGYRVSEIVADGERVSMSIMLMDGAPRASLRDAAGQPVTLHDLQSGGQLKLNTDLIAAIEAEAAKLGMSVNDYVQHVLKYSWSAAKLSGAPSPDSPASKEAI